VATQAANDNTGAVATDAFVITQIPLTTAALAYGAVGSLVLAKNLGATLNPGNTVAGANVSVCDSTGSNCSTQSGTWRYLGWSGYGNNVGGLYLRIS
jgi:hypothetical protein